MSWKGIFYCVPSEPSDEEGVDRMDEDEAPPAKPADPNDLSIYKLDEYDNEVADTGIFSLDVFSTMTDLFSSGGSF